MLGSRLQIASLIVALGTMMVGALSAQTPSGASVADTLGFEDEVAWSLAEGSGAIDFVPDGTQGELSLLLGGTQWRRITTVNLTDAPATSNTATLDVKLLQPVASWESLGLVVQIPSRGIYWQDLGQIPLSQATPNQFTTLSFLLPEAVRDVIHQGGYNDLKILVSANSSAAIVLDNLSFGFPNQGGGPPTAGQNAATSFATGTVLAPYRSAESGPGCASHPLTLTDLRGDFGDIWRGSESPETGKRTELSGNLQLEFDSAIDPETIYAWYEPLEGCSGGWIRAGVPPSSGSWNMSHRGVKFPADFNAFVRQSILGTPDSWGPMAAGGDVVLSSFSINTTSQRPLGLVVGGDLNLSDGTVWGNMWVHPTYQLPGGVTQLSGAKSDTDFNFGIAFAGLEALSRHLGGLDQTGIVSSNYGTVTFRGDEGTLNVFYVDAGTLAAANTINIQLPSGSTGIINVLGNDVSVQNLGISLTGASRNRLLWNLPAAKTVRLRGLSFKGSLLSPRGTVQFDNGNFEGTLVARALQGSGELHFFPFEADLAFPTSSSPVVSLFPERHLEPECKYRFRLIAAGDGNACLVDEEVVTFWTDERESHAWNRELTERTVDPKTGSVRKLKVGGGISTSIEDAWSRYGFGLAADDLVQEGPTTPAAVREERERTFFRQYHQGLPVRGRGYFVESRDGAVRMVVGRAELDLPDLPPPAIGAENAATLALSQLGVSRPPWVDAPQRFAPPIVREVILPSRASSSPRVVFQVDFRDSGLSDVSQVDIDAQDGSLQRVLPRLKEALPNASDFVTTGVNQLTMPTVHGTVDIPVAMYDLGGPDFTRYAYSPDIGVAATLRDAAGVTFAEDTNGDLVWDAADGRSHAAAIFYWSVLGVHDFLEQPRWTFGEVPWIGVRGFGSTPTFVTYEETPDTLSNAFYRQNTFPDPVQLVFTNGPDGPESLLFPEIAAHEVGHAVVESARRRAGLEDLVDVRETGAIGEGLADLFAVTVKREKFPDDPAWYTVGRVRNLLVPQELEGPAYLGDQYYADYLSTLDPDCNGVNDSCGKHKNATIVGHWGTILAAGETSGGPVAPTCKTEVEPLTNDVGESQTQVMQIVLDALQSLDSDGDYDNFRDVTYEVARQRYGEVAAGRVAAAWYNVGVAAADDALPVDGATNVEPWDARISFQALGDGPFTVRIATDEAFQDVVEYIPVPEGSIGSSNRVEVTARLAPDTQYHWQIIPAENPPDYLWENCSLGTWSFTTKAKAVGLRIPQTMEDGVWITDYLGVFAWDSVGGADSYALYLHTESQADGCTGSGVDTASEVANFSRLAFLGESFDVDFAMPYWERYASHLVLGEEFVEPDTDYYLYIQPVSGDERGACTEFVMRKPELGSFARVAPLRAVESGFPKSAEYVDLSIHRNPQPHESFQFTTSAGAEAYRLRVYFDDDDSELPIYDVTRPVDSCALQAPSSGLVEWSFDNACVTAEEPKFWEWVSGDALRWTVDAIRADFSRRAATDGTGFSSNFYYQSDHLSSDDSSPWPLGFYIDMRLESQGIEPASHDGEPAWFAHMAFKGLETGVISVNGDETEAWVEYYNLKTSFFELDGDGTKTIRVDVGDVPFATNYLIAFDDARGFEQGVVDTHVFRHPYFLVASPTMDEVRLILWPLTDDTMARVPTVLRIFTDWTFSPEVPDDDDDDDDDGDEPDCWDENEIPVALPPVGLPQLTSFNIPGTIHNFEIAGQEISMMVPWQSALEPERANGAIPTLDGTAAIQAFREPAGTAGYVAYVSSNEVDFVDRSTDLSGRAPFTEEELPATPLNGYSYHFAVIVEQDACGQFATVGPESIGVFAFDRQ